MASNAARRLGLTLLLLATLAEFASPAPIQGQSGDLSTDFHEPSAAAVRVRRQFPNMHMSRRGHGGMGHGGMGHGQGGFRPGGNRPGAGGGHFGSSSAIAGAQAFQNNGPLGSFGASAANTGTQSVNFRPGGFSGTAGQSMSQNYQLPGGGSASVSLTGGVSVDSQGGASQTGGSSVTITRPKRPMGFNG